jgi:16S rRNA (guanine1516-N2)-methyltransferase
MPDPLKTPAAAIAVSWRHETDHAPALALARRLDLPLAPGAPDAAFHLRFCRGRLELQESGAKTPGPVFVDFTAGKAAYRRLHGGGRKQPLARAVGLKKNRCPHVLDATAGLGRDAFVLAALGCTVTLVERSPILHALLEDGLRRGQTDKDIQAIIAAMTLVHADARLLPCPEPLPDVIYLDPMYPHRDKSSLVKKEMRLTRALVGDDADADALLDWALACCPGRVVVKRPKGAPFLGNKKPPISITSKNSRFDIYLPGLPSSLFIHPAKP